MRVAIVGGGIVGLSIGLACLEKKLGTVTIFEKETEPGLHASRRNSGVLHSGIYYDSDSLKARFSIEGNEELRRLCHNAGIPILESGKLILSQNYESEKFLTKLMERSVANGVNAERKPKRELSSIEPNAITYESFIHVKSTAVSDPVGVFEVLQRRFEELGGKWSLNNHVEKVENYESNSPCINGQRYSILINAAGGNSVSLAKSMGAGLNFYTTPFLGLYWGVNAIDLPLRMPIYPTPHPINPFLGVHLTPTIKGLTKIGPTAIPVLGIEQYSLFQGFNWHNLIESVSALSRIGMGSKHSLLKMIGSEVPKFARSFMVSEASKLHSTVGRVKGWKALPGGIRAQLVTREGQLVQDFIVERKENVVHVLNAVSPGWTSAIPFGRWVVEKYIEGSEEK